jgi:hypothetical protein
LMLARCGDSNPQSNFAPPEGHPADWVQRHGGAFVSDPAGCLECHGDDLLGGISGVGCFSAGFEGTSCHGSPVFHGAGWGGPDVHGPDTKAAPGIGTGFASCQVCHGGDFAGGIIRVSCFTAGCHGVPAPHSPAPWLGAPPARTHTDTNPLNARVCGDCHLGESPTPVPPGPGTPIDCFNNTLCHGSVTHPAGWATDHALDARIEIASCGVASCHGTDFTGGASRISCFECHLGGPAPGGGIMHPDRWPDPEGAHEAFLGNLSKDARSCSPARSGVAQFCHGDGLPNDPAQIIAPPNGSWNLDPDGDPTCWECHDKKWTLP